MLVPRLRLLLLMRSLVARCHARLSERRSRTASDVFNAQATPTDPQMTAQEIESVIRALKAVVDNLDTRLAKESIQEAFVQVRAHAYKTLVFKSDASARPR